MEQTYKRSDVFLTHTWRQDLKGRDTHARVALINNELCRKGVTTWFDTNKMEGKIQEKMKEGIDFTSLVIVFVTEEYMKKIDSQDYDDNCFFEFERAITQKTEKHMLCVVLEEKYENPNVWFGYLKDKLGSCLFLSMAGELNDTRYLNTKMDELMTQLDLKDVKPSQMKKWCIKCNISLGGNYCTYCSSLLQETKEPKSYCSKCRIHVNGCYCSNCQLNLIDEERKIYEAQQHYKNVISWNMDYDSSKYQSLQSKYEEELGVLKQDLHEIRRQREKKLTRGEKLELNDEDFVDKTSLLEERMTGLLKTGSELCTSVNTVKCLRPTFDDKVNKLDEYMLDIEKKRKEMKEISKDLIGVEEKCENDLESIKNLAKELKETSLIPQPENPLNKGHKRSCKCEICIYHEKLKVKLHLDKFDIEDLIKNDDVETLKLSILLEEELFKKKVVDNNMPLLVDTWTNGSLEMVKMLIDMGILDIHTLNLEIVKNSSVERLDMLVQRRYDIKARNKQGETALHVAFLNHKYPDVALWIFMNYPELNVENNSGKKPRLDCNYINATRAKWRGKKLTAPSGFTEMIAKLGDDLHVVKDHTVDELEVLIKLGYDIKACNEQGETALHVAFLNHKYPDVALWIFMNYPELNVENTRGKKPRPDIDYRIAARAKLDDKTLNDSSGFTEMIAKLGGLDVVKDCKCTVDELEVLIRLGYDIKARNEQGETALHVAFLNHKYPEVALWIYTNYPELNVADKHGKKPMPGADYKIAASAKSDDKTLKSSSDFAKMIAKLGDDLDVVKYCAVDEIDMVIKLGYDVKVRNEQGETALHVAFLNRKYPDVAPWIFTNYPELNVKNNRGKKPMPDVDYKIAARAKLDNKTLTAPSSFTKMIAKLGDNLDIVMYCTIDELKMVMKLGYNIKARNERGETALHVAFLNRKYPDVALWIFTNYPKLNVKDNSGKKPWPDAFYKIAARANLDGNTVKPASDFIKMIAKQPGDDLDVVKHYAVAELEVLITLGYDIKACNEQGETALHVAFLNHKYPDVAPWIFTNFPELNVENNLGEKPRPDSDYKMAASAKWDDKMLKASSDFAKMIAKLGDDLDVVKYSAVDEIDMVIKLGYDIKACNEQGETALHVAFLNHRYPDVAPWIFTNFPELNVENNQRKTPRPNVDYRIAARAKLDDKTLTGPSGFTEMIAKLGDLDVVKDCTLDELDTLIHLGYDLKARNEQGETALHVAFRNLKDPKVASWLRENYPELNVEDKKGNKPCPGAYYMLQLIRSRDDITFEALSDYKRIIIEMNFEEQFEGKRRTIGALTQQLDLEPTEYRTIPIFAKARRLGTGRMIKVLEEWGCVNKEIKIEYKY